MIRKRRDTTFEIGQLERRTEAKRQDLIHLNAVIRLFAPNIDPSSTSVRRHNLRRLAYFAHGEITRRCLDMARNGQVAKLGSGRGVRWSLSPQAADLV